MGSVELIKELMDGNILCKYHYDDEACAEFIFSVEYNGEKNIELKGWGTAFGSGVDRLFDVYQHPENWKVIKDFNMNKDEYPYPWSVASIKEIEFK